MRAGVLACVLALAAPTAAAAAEPSNQTVVFYNARIALREDRPADALKLWLLRNSLKDRGEEPHHDDDFESVVWAAMGELGTCPDGFRRDKDGAGLWPLALHNWVIETSHRGQAPPGPRTFPAFDVGRQQRRVSLDDVLTVGELRGVTFNRTRCFAAAPYLIEDLEAPWKALRERRRAAPVMRRLLAISLNTLDRDKVQSVAPIEARIFDLDLAIVELERREAARRGLRAKRQARMLGVTEIGANEIRDAIRPSLPPTSDQKTLLRKSLKWSVDDWMSLSRSRRLFLFDRARAESEDPEALDRLLLGFIDDRIAQKKGAELEMWLGYFGADTPERRATLFAGDRGARMLELDRDTGFRERSVIALHRGVEFLAAGQTEDALRSFAFALAHADESRQTSVNLALSRRWLSYALSTFQTNEDVLAIVKELVPRQEYNAVIDDLVWRAALRADAKSFDYAVAGMRRGSAYDLQVSRLRLLSRGRAGEFARVLRSATAREPNLTLRFIGQLIEHLEAEDAAVRTANVSLLKDLTRVLDPLLGSAKGRRSSSERVAEEHLNRVHAILDGLHELDVSTARARAHTHAPDRSTFAGAIRLAPADPLPWPFVAPEPESPSVFMPLRLEPVEWRNDKGNRVFGWRISDAAE